MLIRISLIVAIIAGLAAVALTFIPGGVKEKVTNLQTDRETQKHDKEVAQTDLKKTKSDLAKTTSDLKQTKATLDATTTERDTAVAEADKQSKRAGKLEDDLKKTTGERDTAVETLAAYKATGVDPKQIVAMVSDMKDLKKNLADVQRTNSQQVLKIDNLNAELDLFIHPDRHILLPASLKGVVRVVDPKWNFVVLNIGEDQHLKNRGELLVNRDGKLVAKVQISDMQKDRAIANVMAGWEIGQVMEGDQVIPAWPEQ